MLRKPADVTGGNKSKSSGGAMKDGAVKGKDALTASEIEADRSNPALWHTLQGPGLAPAGSLPEDEVAPLDDPDAEDDYDDEDAGEYYEA